METTKDTFMIRTPEQVGFEYVLAGLGSRGTAFLLDTLLRGFLILFIFVMVMLFSQWLPALDPTGLLKSFSGGWGIALGILAYGVVDLGYFLIFEAFWSGQTPGKRQQKLRVIRQDGQPIGWIESAVRNILRAVDILGGIYPLGLIVIFVSRKNQRLGDLAAGTVVILERRCRVPKHRTRLRSGKEMENTDLDLHISRLEPKQYQLLRSFLQRREEMDWEHRHQLAKILAQRLMDRWKMRRETESSPEVFLERVVARYEEKKRAI